GLAFRAVGRAAVDRLRRDHRRAVSSAGARPGRETETGKTHLSLCGMNSPRMTRMNTDEDGARSSARSFSQAAHDLECGDPSPLSAALSTCRQSRAAFSGRVASYFHSTATSRLPKARPSP